MPLGGVHLNAVTLDCNWMRLGFLFCEVVCFIDCMCFHCQSSSSIHAPGGRTAELMLIRMDGLLLYLHTLWTYTNHTVRHCYMMAECCPVSTLLMIQYVYMRFGDRIDRFEYCMEIKGPIVFGFFFPQSCRLQHLLDPGDTLSYTQHLPTCQKWWNPGFAGAEEHSPASFQATFFPRWVFTFLIK